MRLPRLRRQSTTAEPREEWLATAALYANHLTETGSRCHLNDGSARFCHWRAVEIAADAADGESTPMVGVRCSIHPGGRFLDASARLDPGGFA